jgi:hypothetical protein
MVKLYGISGPAFSRSQAEPVFTRGAGRLIVVCTGTSENRSFQRFPYDFSPKKTIKTRKRGRRLGIFP